MKISCVGDFGCMRYLYGRKLLKIIDRKFKSKKHQSDKGEMW